MAKRAADAVATTLEPSRRAEMQGRPGGDFPRRAGENRLAPGRAWLRVAHGRARGRTVLWLAGMGGLVVGGLAAIR